MEEQKGKKKSGKKRKIPLFLIIMFLGVSFFALGKMVYAKYVVPRPVEFTTFSPFERRIFDLDSSKIKEIGFRGWVYKSRHINLVPPPDIFDTKDEIEDLVEYLNSFRYTHTAPAPDSLNIGKGQEPHCNLWIETWKGAKFSCLIEKNRIYIGEVWYYGDPDFFQKLLELVN